MAEIIKAILYRGEPKPDAQILEQVIKIHAHTDSKLDVDSLLNHVENILSRSTHIVDNVFQGSLVSSEHFEDKTPQASFNSPLCILKKISSEMSCKSPGGENAHKTTLRILEKLKGYSWSTKAVLTLAAFAIECGDFWLLSQYQPTDPLAKSLAILKRVPVLTKPDAKPNCKLAIVELNHLIKSSLQVIKTICKLETYTSKYDIKDVPALGPALKQLPLDAYWIIITIVACVTQIDCLITESEERQDLSYFGQKINVLLRELTKQKSQAAEEIEELEYNKLLMKIFEITHWEIMDALKVLIFRNDVPQNPIYNGATKELVSIDVLKEKNVLLFISTLDITEKEIEILRPIYGHPECGEKCKIVWVPIVEHWTDSNKHSFEKLKSKMPWFVVQHFVTIKGYKYIKEKWHFNKQPMAVTISPQSEILYPNAFPLIQAYGLKAFHRIWGTEVPPEPSWDIETLVKDFNPNIPTWIKEGKYIFFYGGNGKGLLQKLDTCAQDLQQLLRKANISIELVSIQTQNEDRRTSFWNGIESLFITKIEETTQTETTHTVTREVRKMLSYRYEDGWGLLIEGSTVVLTGHGVCITEAVEEYQKVDPQKIKVNFKNTFKKVLGDVEKKPGICPCSHVPIPIANVKNPEPIECPMCRRTMKVFISYKCCHEDGTVASSINGERDPSIKQK